MVKPVAVPLSPALSPRFVAVSIPARDVSAVEVELRGRACLDQDGCCGYFPSLEGTPGIVSELPVSRRFAARHPTVLADEEVYAFSFLRLSLVQQSRDAAFHLDSDAATAVTGEVATMGHRRVSRLLLNLSPRRVRALHFLDVDPASVDLVVEGAYIRVADPEPLRQTVRVAAIPPRQGATVHGLVFESSRVLHSGVDDDHGHFVAAYGIDTAALNARKT